ncbi:hypothetical protein BGW41_003729 [Actinomortierella wolfii]|nr:hypothetical protein BGW41_003729 [Actinomortierella wolfii]
MSNVGDLFADIPNFFEANGLHTPSTATNSTTTPAPSTTEQDSPATTTAVGNSPTTTSSNSTTVSAPITTVTNGSSGGSSNNNNGSESNTSNSGAGKTNGLLVFDIGNSANMTIPTSEYLAMQNKISEQAVELAKQTREIRNLKKNVSNLKERVMATSTIKKRLDEFNNNLAQANREKDQALQEKAQATREKDQALQEKVQVIQEKAQLKLENTQLVQAQQQLNARVAETEKIRQELVAAKREISKANSRTNAKQQEVTETKGLLMKTRAEQDNLKRTLASQQAEIERLKQELGAAKVQNVQDQGLEARIEDLKSQLDDQSTEYEIERSAWEAKAEMAVKSEERVRQEAAQIKSDNERLQSELALAKTDAQRARQEMERAKADAERLQRELSEARKAAAAAIKVTSTPPPPSPAVTSTPETITTNNSQRSSVSTDVVSQIQDTLAMFAEASEKLKLLNVLGTAGCFSQERSGDSATVITSLQRRISELEKEKAALQEHISSSVIQGTAKPMSTRRRASVVSRTVAHATNVDYDTSDLPSSNTTEPAFPPTSESTTDVGSTEATTTTTVNSTTTALPTATAKPVRARATRKRKTRESEVDLASIHIRNISQISQENGLVTPADTTTPTPAATATVSPDMTPVSTLAAHKTPVAGSGTTPTGSNDVTDQRASKRPRGLAASPATPVAPMVASSHSSRDRVNGNSNASLLARTTPVDTISKLVAIMEQPPPQPKMVKLTVRLVTGKPDLLTKAILKRAKAIRPIVSQHRQAHPHSDLCEEERNIVMLVKAIQSKRPRLYEQVLIGLGKSLIHEMEGVTITRLEGTTVVARLTAALYKEAGDITRMRSIVYDILREYPPSSKLSFTLCEHIASIWPLVFQLDDVQEGDDGGAQVMLQTFQAVIKEAYDKHATDIRFFGYSTFVDKCEWPKLEEAPSCKDLAEYLMEVASTSVFRSRYGDPKDQDSSNGSMLQQQVIGTDFAFQLCKSLEVLLTQAYNATEVQQWFSTSQATSGDKAEEAGENASTSSSQLPSLYRMMLESERYPLAIPLVARVFGDRRFRKPSTMMEKQATATVNVAALCDLLCMILQSTATLPHQITAAMALLELLSSSSVSGGGIGGGGNMKRLQQLSDWYNALETEAERQAVPETLRVIVAKVGTRETQKEEKELAAVVADSSNHVEEEVMAATENVATNTMDAVTVTNEASEEEVSETMDTSDVCNPPQPKVV